MRAPIVTLLLLGLLAAATGATAHGEPGEETPYGHLEHLGINQLTLEPGADRLYHIGFQGGPLREGWILLLQGETTGPLRIDLSYEGAAITNWTWEAGGWRLVTTALPATSGYELRLTNVGDEALDASWTFDQSCECSAKWMEQAGGTVVFNWDLAYGERAEIEFNLTLLGPGYHPVDELANLTIDGVLARQVGPAGVWPEDFDIVASSTYVNRTFPVVIEASERTEDERERYYLFMTPRHDSGPLHTVLMLPLWEQTVPTTAGEEEGAPGLGPLAIVAALGVAVGAVLRRRN
ncbi:MAG: hypothetical protein ACPGQL_10360 [Thermoplasmatota archaeon]